MIIDYQNINQNGRSVYMTTVSTKSGRIIKVVSREEEKRAYVEYTNGERKYAEQKTDDSCFSRTKWLREKYNNNFFDKVVERYYKSINNIKELLNICDIMHVYDNTKTPERIIRKHKDELSIYLNEYWTEQDILGLME